MKIPRRFVLLTLAILLFMSGMIAVNFSQATVLAGSAGGALAPQLASHTPNLPDTSEIGSTDGILFMGFVIALIVTVPLLLR